MDILLSDDFWYSRAVIVLSAAVLVFLLLFPFWKKLIMRTSRGYRFFTDSVFHERILLHFSFALNAAFSVFYFISAVYAHSFWQGALAAYYLALSTARFFLLRYFFKTSDRDDAKSELHLVHLCGMLLIVLNIALTAILYFAVFYDQGFYYPGILVFAIALYAFYALALALRNVFLYRSLHRPALIASKMLTLSAALLSLFSLTTALIGTFGEPGSFRTRVTGILGFVIVGINFLMAALLVMTSNQIEVS